ncbi:hypothetical protein AB0J83_21530 [Actinoplanes sp. NPDC049596]|uniref:hypothetical protein n=1 Tax=unclassified Actinoplanes TaxID=2626549 RepID=UPI00343BF168
MTSVKQERVDKVARRVSGAERTFAARHPAHAGPIRASLGKLREGLERAHEKSDLASEREWSSYMASLDQGLAELDVEVGRAAEGRDSRSVSDVLDHHTSALEEAGWRLQFSLDKK